MSYAIVGSGKIGQALARASWENEGGALVHARGGRWGPLIFQDLFKKEQ